VVSIPSSNELHMRLCLVSIPTTAAETAYRQLPPNSPSLLADTVSHIGVAWSSPGTFYVSLIRSAPKQSRGAIISSYVTWPCTIPAQADGFTDCIFPTSGYFKRCHTREEPDPVHLIGRSIPPALPSPRYTAKSKRRRKTRRPVPPDGMG